MLRKLLVVLIMVGCVFVWAQEILELKEEDFCGGKAQIEAEYNRMKAQTDHAIYSPDLGIELRTGIADLPLWGTDIDFGLADMVNIDVVPAGSDKGTIFVATLRQHAWAGGRDTVFTYYSTDGGSSWNNWWLIYTSLGKQILDFDIACSREKLAFLGNTYSSSYSQAKIEGFIFDFQSGDEYVAIDSMNVNDPYYMCPDLVSDAEDFSSNIWYYIVYNKAGNSSDSLLFKAFNETGQIQGSATLSSNYYCGSGDIDWDFDNLFVTYTTYEYPDDHVYARFSPNYGSSWNGPFHLGSKRWLSRIAGHDFEAVVVTADYSTGTWKSSYSYTTTFGNNWSGPYYQDDGTGTESPAVTEIDPDNKYNIAYERYESGPGGALRVVACNMNCTSQGWYDFIPVQDPQYVGLEFSLDICYLWNSGISKAGIVWIDERMGSSLYHAWFDCGNVGIEEYNAIASKVSRLYPCSPNPVKNSFSIHYEVPQTCYVNLTLYDAQGRKIITLADKQHTSGKYLVSVNLSQMHIPNGIYFYQLKTEDFTETRKMIVLR